MLDELFLFIKMAGFVAVVALVLGAALLFTIFLFKLFCILFEKLERW